MVLDDPRRQRGERFPRRLERDAGPEPRDDLDEAIAAGIRDLLLREPDRPAEIALPIVAEAFGKDADDLVRPSVEGDAAADDRRIGAEPPPPRARRDEHDAVVALHVLGRGEGAAEHRLDAERLEKAGGDGQDLDALGPVGEQRRGLAGNPAGSLEERKCPQVGDDFRR